MKPEFIDTYSALQEFLTNLPLPKAGPPCLYVDLEGNDLSRQGTLSLLTVLVVPRNTVHLVDVTTLGQAAFGTADVNGQTLQSVLESEDIIKVFFDIRNDSDALYSHFGIRVAGIQDVQLMELAGRSGSKRLINGLSKCIEYESSMGYEKKREWREVKNRGRRLFAPELGGSFAVFDHRPLTPEIIEYCAQDVQLLPDLRNVYRRKLCDAWWKKIAEETGARIRLSQSQNYNGKGRHMTLGPPSWSHWAPTAAERNSRVLLEQEDGHRASEDSIKAETASAPPKSPHTDSTAEPSSSGAVQSEIGVIGRALQQMMQQSAGASSDGDEDDRYGGFSSSRAYSDSDKDGTGPDLTACDKECGYCGRCMY